MMKRGKNGVIACLALALVLVSCASDLAVRKGGRSKVIEPSRLVPHIKTLASDEFEGRLPASKGEELSVNYIADQFRRIGLKPGSSDGTYFQPVPLNSITADPAMALELDAGSETMKLSYGDEFMAWTTRFVDDVRIDDSEIVFVGYGTVAPEFDWDDYKGVDVKGKTLIMLVGDPPIPDPDDPDKLDDKVFGGRAMTYYGRWTYKFEMAAEKGAEACFVLHETEPAGYPWGVVKGSWTGEQFDLLTPDNNMSHCAVEGWMPYAQVEAAFQLAGQDLAALKKMAIRRDFKPTPINLKASLAIENTTRSLASRNVIGVLEGTDPKLKDEYVIYMAHWGHLGKDTSLEGDQIFNGALDNATGVAGMIEMARAFSKLNPAPRRSIVFLAVAAEEQGLLGSKYYAVHPVYPLVRTLAAINMDGMNIFGRTKDITVVGLGNSTLDEIAVAVAGEQGRVVKPDPEPQKGSFYRSDHFSLAKQGVPALNTGSGVDFVGRPEGWGLKKRKEYTEKNYHKPSDEYDPEWDLSGAVEDLELLFEVGRRVADGETYPQWKAGTEFKALREQTLREAGTRQ
jgi:Zn-dependent M28 family amino/carboxypeptidase